MEYRSTDLANQLQRGCTNIMAASVKRTLLIWWLHQCVMFVLVGRSLVQWCRSWSSKRSMKSLNAPTVQRTASEQPSLQRTLTKRFISLTASSQELSGGSSLLSALTVQLHVMQCTVLLSQFCLSIRLSVRLSDACIVTKLNDALQIFWYHTKRQSLWFCDTNSGWWATPPSL